MIPAYVDPATGTRVEDLMPTGTAIDLLFAILLAVIAWELHRIARHLQRPAPRQPETLFSSARGDRAAPQESAYDRHLLAKVTAWRDEIDGPEQ